MPDEWIRQWGDPVLREVAAPVTHVDEVLRMQLRRMAVRLEEVDGAGLAATQVGFLRRAFVYRAIPRHPPRRCSTRASSFAQPSRARSSRAA